MIKDFSIFLKLQNEKDQKSTIKIQRVNVIKEASRMFRFGVEVIRLGITKHFRIDYNMLEWLLTLLFGDREHRKLSTSPLPRNDDNRYDKSNDSDDTKYAQ